MGLRPMTSGSIIHMDLHKLNNKLINATFGARIRHKQTQTHKIDHGPDLGEATTFPLIIFFMCSHGACTQMLFCPRTPKLGVLKFSKLRLL
jgi:hypothetical protein